MTTTTSLPTARGATPTTLKTVFVYDGWNSWAELDANNSNAVLRTYTWGRDAAGMIGGGGFATQYTDRESGLVYYGKRFYSPKLGRFINRDPVEEQGGLNFYCFVGNGPTNSWDVLGMFEMNDVFAPAPDDDALMLSYHPTWTKIDEDSWYDPERDIQFNYRGGGNEAVLYPDETAPIWEHGFDIWQADMARDAAFYRSADAAFDAFVASQPVADGVLLSGVGTTITHLLGRDKETGVATVTFGELTELSDEQDAYYRQRAAANAANSADAERAQRRDLILARIDAGQHPSLAADGGAAAGSRVDPAVTILIFNGQHLLWFDVLSGKLLRSYAGVSGRAGFQSATNQGLVDKGPIPAGWYIARQSELQKYPESNLTAWQGAFGRGPWPGNKTAWGDFRVWLEPGTGTDTLGRSGFSIHGGQYPGSAGCIDLTGDMSRFATDFVANGRDMVVRVDYGFSFTPPGGGP